MPGTPLAYFITFRSYGTWLTGDERGCVVDEKNDPATPVLPYLPETLKRSKGLMKRPPLILDEVQRGIADATVRMVCAYKGWFRHALHVRTTHVHVVLTAPGDPDPVMNSLKAWCTRQLADDGAIPRGVKPWARHGSTRYIWTRAKLAEAIRYVMHEQGPPLPMVVPVWARGAPWMRDGGGEQTAR